jgi:nitroreductase
MRDDASARIDGSVEWLVDNLGAVPALVVACVEPYLPDREDGADFASSTLYGSIYPAVWNLQLALASRGLGSCPTTVLLMKADRLRNVLGIPASHIPACMLPVAHISSGPPFGPAPRRPVDEVVTWNGWNAAATG